MKMVGKIYYVVETLFWRVQIGNKLDFILNGDIKEAIQHSVEEFKDTSPIAARENAFNHFRSIVDVLYDGIGKNYTTENQARVDLQPYFNSGNSLELLSSIPNKKFQLSEDILNGIEVYVVTEEPLDGNREQTHKHLIHSIGYADTSNSNNEDVISCLKGLITEYKFYEKYFYPLNNYIEYLVLDNVGGGCDAILKTPFDWEAFFKKDKDKVQL